MKTLIFVLVLIGSMFAQSSPTGYFTETTQGNVSKYGDPGFAYGLSDTVSAGDTTYYITSPVFGSSAVLTRNISDKAIGLGIDIDVAFEDVAATLILQASFNKTDWFDVSTLDSDTTPNVTGVQLYKGSAVDVYAPYWRMKFNGGGLDIGSSGKIKFLYGVPL